MGVAIVLLVYVIVSYVFDRRSALFSALIVALCYPLVYYAHNANVEVPYLFWALLAIYYFLRLQKDGCLKHYVLFALFGMLSICTKDQAYGLFLFSPLIILWTRFTEVTRTSSQQLRWMGIFFDRRLLIAAVVAVGTFVLAHNLLFNFSGFLKHVRWLTGPGSQPWVSYAPTLTGRLQLLWATGAVLAQGFTLPLFGLCIVGAVYCALKFPRYSLPLLFLAASYYFTFINVILYLRLRFVLPIGIILAFFGGKLLADIWHSGPWKKLRRGAICLAFIYAGLFPVQLDLLLMGRESRYAAEQWIQQHFRKDAIVETFAAQNVRLGWDYPRFPHWIKVRRGKLAAGTQWMPYETPPDTVRLPNLYSGREAPDYIVLSTPSAGRVRPDSEEEKTLAAFYQGRLGYALVATFKAPTIVPIRLLPVNPKIDIFENRSITLPSSRQ
jgi:Dolichyl-phosphate-mannose-protein mannosyltransferase